MRIPQGISGLGFANFAPTQAAGSVTADQVMSALRGGDPTKLQALKDQIEKMDPKEQKALLDQLQQLAKQLKDPKLDDLIKYLEELLGIRKPDGGGGGGGGGGAGKAGGGGGGGGAQGAGGAEGGGGAGGAGGAGGGEGAGGAGGPGAAGGAQGATAPGDLQVSNPKISQALAGIAKDPEGGRLLNAALQKGLVKVVENKNLPPGVEGRYTNTGNGKGFIEVRDANSPDLVATLSHELGHAATPENNSSQLEERAVDAIGARIQARVTGRGKGWDLNTDAYSDLPWDNNIKNALKLIGVDM